MIDAKQAFEILLFSTLIFLIACTYNVEEIPAENGTIEICFTLQEDCEAKLASMISSSASVKAALYDLDAPGIINALREKDAEVLIYENNHDGYGTAVESEGLMHNKFFILYGASGGDYLVTGSTNPTVNGFGKNANNMIIINSPTLIRNYEEEFDEIRTSGKQKRTKQTRIIFNGFEVENYFCPEDGCEEEVLEELEDAEESVYFMAFSFTSDPIGKLLMERDGELDIRGIFDRSQAASNREYSEHQWMEEAGMDVKTAGGIGGKGKLHHKVFIIDNRTVITGSYNPTASGNERNDENVMIIHDAGIADEYLREFERTWNES